AVTAATTPAPPAPTTTQPRAPRPDKSQGGGGGGGASYETQIADAQKRGDWQTAVRLQREQLAENRTLYGRNYR
ncbi:MAG TPA: hypothetical protein VJT49_09275, partial [Amycolatopsis sp.]|uniref:hypothetical protein n=1 Tax=Amycolatopsis sp. TaxID=37632 RepID=UPI002B47D352